MTYRMGFIAAAVALTAAGGVQAADATAGGSWQGFYVGAFGGVTQFESTSTDLAGEEFGGSTPGAQEAVSDNGSLLGFTFGYNMRRGNWVYGPEFEIGRINGDALRVVNGDDGVLVEYDGVYGSLTGRVGYVNDQTLIYGKAGLAWSDITNVGGEFDGVGSEGSGGILGFDGNEGGFGDGRRSGYTFGFGVEHALTGNWSVKAEYGFIKYIDALYYPLTDTDEPFAFEDDLHTVKLGLNYNF